MRMRIGVNVGDELRRHIGRHYACKFKLSRKKLADRRDCKAWLEQNYLDLEDIVKKLHKDSQLLYAPLTQMEKHGIERVIEYLKAQGKNNLEIRSWILMQTARANFDTRLPLKKSTAEARD